MDEPFASMKIAARVSVECVRSAVTAVTVRVDTKPAEAIA